MPNRSVNYEYNFSFPLNSFDQEQKLPKKYAQS